MKSIYLKATVSLIVFYMTGWMWLPERAVTYLYTFGEHREALLRDQDAREFASKTCLDDETVKAGKDFDNCWDNAYAQYK